MKPWIIALILLALCMACLGGTLAEEPVDNPFFGVYELRLVYTSPESMLADGAADLEGQKVTISASLYEGPSLEWDEPVRFEPPFYTMWNLDDASREAMFESWALADDGFRREFDMRMIPGGKNHMWGMRAEYFKTGDTMWRMDVETGEPEFFDIMVHTLYEMVPIDEMPAEDLGAEAGISVWSRPIPEWMIALDTNEAYIEETMDDREEIYGTILDCSDTGILISMIYHDENTPVAQWVELTENTKLSRPLKYNQTFSVYLDENGAAEYIIQTNG